MFQKVLQDPPVVLGPHLHFATSKPASSSRHPTLLLPCAPVLIVKASLLWAVRGVLHILYLTGPLPETPEGDTVKVFYVGE